MAAPDAARERQLVIGQKNYSSWSLRPWILLKHLGIAFEEVHTLVDGKGVSERHKAFSPSGLVPCLIEEDGFHVWDSLAIMEFANDLTGGAAWPRDPRARAFARCIAAEMHSGFVELRACLPMNIKMVLRGKPFPADKAEKVAVHVARIQQIWTEARERFADKAAGPYLFGAFSAADAMYAPVVWRFLTYNVPVDASPAAAEYFRTMLADPHMRAWRAAALVEGDAIGHYDATAVELGGEPRAFSDEADLPPVAAPPAS